MRLLARLDQMASCLPLEMGMLVDDTMDTLPVKNKKGARWVGGSACVRAFCTISTLREMLAVLVYGMKWMVPSRHFAKVTSLRLAFLCSNPCARPALRMN